MILLHLIFSTTQWIDPLFASDRSKMADQLARAEDFEKKAEKKLSGWGLFSSKFEDAADLFDKAANSFKLAKSCIFPFSFLLGFATRWNVKLSEIVYRYFNCCSMKCYLIWNSSWSDSFCYKLVAIKNINFWSFVRYYGIIILFHCVYTILY